MEGEVSSASSCMPISKMMEYSYCHEAFDTACPPPFLSLPPRDVEGVGSDGGVMGNLLTDMLSSDFFYGTSSRYSVPNILQNFPTDQSSKISLLQMLEDSSDTTSSYSVHLKLPVLEEAADKKGLQQHNQQQQQLQHEQQQQQQQHLQQEQQHLQQEQQQEFQQEQQQEFQQEQQQQFQQERQELQHEEQQQQQQQLATADDFSRTCKQERDPHIPDCVQLEQQAVELCNACPSDLHKLQQSSAAANSEENSSDKQLGVSQSSSGTETQTQQQPARPKRKRAKSCKNSEEVESQRQTHIAVERNRRKQMNEHLSVLRSLMPGSYVQKGDQASIIGGAIEFVKELEQLLQCLQTQKRRRMYSEVFSPKPSPTTVTSMLQQPPCPFPPAPYSPVVAAAAAAAAGSSKFVNDNFYEPAKEAVAEVKSVAAEVEVRVTGSDAVLKILSQRRPGQLLRTISALEGMCMTIVHTNVTTIEQTVLYSFTVKLGAECRLSVEEIAESIQRVFGLIHCNAAPPVAAAAVPSVPTAAEENKLC